MKFINESLKYVGLDSFTSNKGIECIVVKLGDEKSCSSVSGFADDATMKRIADGDIKVGDYVRVTATISGKYVNYSFTKRK